MVTKKKNTPDKTKRALPTNMSKKTYIKYKPILERMQEGSQNYLILMHLLEHGSITPKEAERKPIYSMRLSARIWDLRHDYKIPIESKTITKKRGKKVIAYAEYSIGG